MSLNSDREKTRVTYPFSITGVYISVILAGISTVFTLLLLQGQPILLAYYFLIMSLIMAVGLILKIRLLSSSPKANENLVEGRGTAIGWRTLLLFLLMLIAAVSLPILLSKVLDNRIWFTLLTSFISGISISEILFYLYAARAGKKSMNTSVERNQLIKFKEQC